MEDEEEVEKQHKLEVFPTGDPDDETCTTFVLHGEDHTLGNSLRYMIMKNPEVKCCGYSIPHPSEDKINLRIQTYGDPASDVLRRGLSELSTLCEHALATFEASVEDYKQMKANQGLSVSSADES